jgi:DNA-directed RNA polymerase subunit beta'
MRTFHIGGVGSIQTEQSTLEARFGGVVKFEDMHYVERDDSLVVMNRHAQIHILDDKGRTRERYDLVYGAKLMVKAGEVVGPGQHLAEWDPFTIPIITEVDGIIEYGDIIEGVTMQVRVDEVTSHASMVVQESRDPDARPRLVVKNADGEVGAGSRASTRRATSSRSGAAFTMTEGDVIQRRRRDRQAAAREHQDEGHHRRSAARGRALRGAYAQGPRDHL